MERYTSIWKWWCSKSWKFSFCWRKWSRNTRKCNGKTEILNKSQIASSIYSAVFSAMSQFNGGGIAEINVHADEGIIVDTAINGINQKTKQTGVCPVNIPTY